jgi:hypothetical protein
MCQEASFVGLKDAVYWSEVSDSHEDIIEEHGIHIDGARGPNGVRFEIVPPDSDYFSDPETWEYRLDQAEVPEWYDAADMERRGRIALADWLKCKVVTAGEVTANQGNRYISGNASANIGGNASADIWDNARANIRDNASADIWGNARADIWDNARANIRDNAHADIGGNAHANIGGNARADIWDNARADIGGNASVHVYDRGVAVKTSGNPVVTLHGPHAVMIDQRGAKAKCRIGK